MDRILIESKMGTLPVHHWEILKINIDLPSKSAALVVAFYAAEDAKFPFSTKSYEVKYDESDPELQNLYDNLEAIANSRVEADLGGS